MRGLYQRGGVWWIRFPMKDGFRPHPISLRTTEYLTAVAKAADVREHPILAESQTLRREIKAHLEERAYTRPTRCAKEGVLVRFVEGLPWGTKMRDVTQAQVKSFYETLVSCRSRNTAHKQLMDIQAFFRWAVEKNKIRWNPALGIERGFSFMPTKVLFCELELMDKLINECDREDLKLILMLGFHAGFRRNEIVHAVPEWFDLHHGVIHMRDTQWKKFNRIKKARSLPMRPELKTFLTGYGLREPFLLRPDRKQKRNKNRYDFSKPFSLYMELQRWEDKPCSWVTPHVLRHTFASLLALQGTPMFEIAKCMGTTVSTVERVYAHLNPRYRNIDLRRGA